MYLQIVIFPLGSAETAVVNHQATITFLQSAGKYIVTHLKFHLQHNTLTKYLVQLLNLHLLTTGLSGHYQAT